MKYKSETMHQDILVPYILTDYHIVINLCQWIQWVIYDCYVCRISKKNIWSVVITPIYRPTKFQFDDSFNFFDFINSK